MRFVAAPEYPVFPTGSGRSSPTRRSCARDRETRPVVARVAPDVVVHDILTLAPAMAAELEGIPARR